MSGVAQRTGVAENRCQMRANEWTLELPIERMTDIQVCCDEWAVLNAYGLNTVVL